MTELTFKKSGPLFTQVQMDGHGLFFNADNVAKATIPENEYHLVQWFVRGHAGEEWTVELTDPPMARFSFKGRLGPDGKDGNFAWVIVPGDEQ
jgi:hypothetical protein